MDQAGAKKGVTLVTNTSVMSIQGNEMQGSNNYTGATSLWQVDHVLIANAPAANDGIYRALKEAKPDLPLFLVGDACAPRRLENAIHEGFLAGCTV